MLYIDGRVVVYDLHSGESKRMRQLDGSVDLAAGFDFYAGLKQSGRGVADGKCSNDSFARYAFSDLTWHKGVSVFTCECHLALLKKHGTVKCADGHGYDATSYKNIIEKWKNIKQLALTFERPYGLTFSGEFVCEDRDEYIKDYFRSQSRSEIVQIAAFGCYYSSHVVAVLYADGTVRAHTLFMGEIEEVKNWRNIKKIRCGIHTAVGALTDDGRLLIEANIDYVDDAGNIVIELNNIYDFEMNFFNVLAITKSGRLIILKQKR